MHTSISYTRSYNLSNATLTLAGVDAVAGTAVLAVFVLVDMVVVKSLREVG